MTQNSTTHHMPLSALLALYKSQSPALEIAELETARYKAHNTPVRVKPHTMTQRGAARLRVATTRRT